MKTLSPSHLLPLAPRPDSDKFLSGKITPDKRLPVIDRNAVDPQLRAGAEGMEAMFLDFLMKTMRDTVPQSEMSLDSPASRVYTSMLDNEMAQTAAKAGGVGLAEQIIAYMESQRYNQVTGQDASSATSIDRSRGQTKE